MPIPLKMCANDSKRPLVITQYGKGDAVLLDIHEYEALREKIELLTDIQISVNQIASGEGVDQEEAKEQVLRQATTSRSFGRPLS